MPAGHVKLQPAETGSTQANEQETTPESREDLSILSKLQEEQTETPLPTNQHHSLKSTINTTNTTTSDADLHKIPNPIVDNFQFQVDHQITCEK